VQQKISNTKEAQMSNRLSWADNAKAIGMLLVFWGHIIERGAFSGNPLLHHVYKCIYAFHMPMFFLLAGFFFRTNKQRFGTYFVQRIKMRLIPALFLVAIITPLWLWPAPNFTYDPASLQQTWLLLQGKPIANWTCWFLICLFVVELWASEIIPGFTKRTTLFIFILALYAVAYQVTVDSSYTANKIGIVENWWFLQEATMALFFYLSGYALAQYGRYLLPGNGKRSVVLLVASLLLVLATYNLNFSGGLGTVNMSGSSHGDWLWFALTALTGSLAVIHLGDLLPKNKLLSLIGENTLPLLGFAGLFLHFLNAPLWNFITATTDNPVLVLLSSLLVAIASLLLSLPFAYLLSRYTPFLVGHWK
jgi:fucose 4-O-acetylase-like acetyltransferase